uniref:Uncharacterized protein n=1 Tax=Acrobeloides nanus TaxID=290746 RepID=A0A914DXZ7_9BILA
MTKITIAALKTFESHQWIQFDALVGDCGCQIRAVKIKGLADLLYSSSNWRVVISNTINEAQNMLRKLAMLKEKIDKKFIKFGHLSKKYGSPIKPLVVCSELDILQKFNEDIRFVIECYLLTQTKVLVPREDCFYQAFDATKPENLQAFNVNDLNGQLKSNNREEINDNKKISRLVGYHKLKNIVKLVQVDLSSISAKYATKIFESSMPSLINTINFGNFIKKDEAGRSCVPSFYCLETITQHIINTRKHLLLDISRWSTNGKRVDRFKKLYVGKTEVQDLCEVSPNDPGIPRCVIVFIGHCIQEDQQELTRDKYIKLLQTFKLKDLLSMIWAQHPQFPGKMVEDFDLPIDNRRKSLAEKAQRIGCSIKNMSLLLITHIYCDRLNDALNNMSFEF